MNTVLVVEPGRVPYVKEIDSGLKSLQSEVGGWIEAICPFEEEVALICNEEGKLCGDVNFEEADRIVDAITPVPGGAGSVTTSVLVSHVVEAAMRKFL